MPAVKTLIKLRSSRAIIVPATWLRYHERRLGATILEVEIHEVGDDLVIKVPAAANEPRPTFLAAQGVYPPTSAKEGGL